MSRHSITNPAQRIALTDRQEDVLKLVSRGLTNAEIAERLGVTLDGVKWHIREILGKFGVESREQAVARWREENGVTRGPVTGLVRSGARWHFAGAAGWWWRGQERRLG